MLIAEKGIQGFTLRIPIFPRTQKSLASRCLAWIGDDAFQRLQFALKNNPAKKIFGVPGEAPGLFHRPATIQKNVFKNPRLKALRGEDEHEPLSMCRKEHRDM